MWRELIYHERRKGTKRGARAIPTWIHSHCGILDHDFSGFWLHIRSLFDDEVSLVIGEEGCDVCG
jgi:hypothetical protein